jgi:IS5 family transposase
MELLRQPVATGRIGFRLFLRFPALDVLPVIATGCNHGALSEEGLLVKSASG